RFLAPLAAGDVRSSFAMTEPHPGTGSDPSALATRAVKDGDEWVINGDKRFISGAELSSFFIVMAATDAEDSAEIGDGSGSAQARKGQAATMFLVPKDTPGVSVGRSIHTVDRTI